MRDKNKKLGDIKVPDKLYSVWKERGGERERKRRRENREKEGEERIRKRDTKEAQ